MENCTLIVTDSAMVTIGNHHHSFKWYRRWNSYGMTSPFHKMDVSNAPSRTNFATCAATWRIWDR